MRVIVNYKTKCCSHNGFYKRYNFFKFSKVKGDHENYGTTHTIKHVFVDEKERDMLFKYYKFDCRSCGNKI